MYGNTLAHSIAVSLAYSNTTCGDIMGLYPCLANGGQLGLNLPDHLAMLFLL